MVTRSVSQARATLPQLLDRVEAGEAVVVTRHGREVAVIVRPDALRTRHADRSLEAAAEVRDRLMAARRAPLPEHGLTPERADSLVSEVRSDRAAR
ncbi:hypothetical protein BH23ACT2_BH23ACT2_19350 [soil metagenome]